MWKNYNYFLGNKKGRVRAIPGRTRYSIWILGSSTESAYLAAAKGLPYVLRVILLQHNSQCRIYRNNFQPSEH
jgi:alkanesulfonate monooxygenase SsuD/methylene tetrahydromethanopterin reductase-like flavin-dependent oxidoreductase (luciferase family)